MEKKSFEKIIASPLGEIPGLPTQFISSVFWIHLGQILNFKKIDLGRLLNIK